MPETSRVTILLADEDALRREGLAAVLSGTDNFEIVGGVPDGESALAGIRVSRPDVAVVDLNLPELHGIELVRRIRAEGLGTKVIILAGTTDDEIIREVVRAGGDGYLLKNGPARHLIDAISYVRDGGQYFSPQLRRDGLDRHLLEEPARTNYEEPAAKEAREEPEFRRVRPSRARTVRRTNRPENLRERIREEAEPGLVDRDYEIMTMMADGIRPILDRLDEIDNRVAQMEVGDAPVPANPRGWLSSQLVDTLRETRAPGDVANIGRSVTDIESRLPELIEEAVTKRFHQMAGKLQEQIEETHVRTLETFVKNIQVKLVQRVSALEQDMSSQASAMNDLREYSQRTEDNLSRLITGVDKLAQELPKRLAAVAAETPAAGEASVPQKPVRRNTSSSRKRIARILQIAVGLAILLAIMFWGIRRMNRPGAPETVVTAVTAKPLPPGGGADNKTKMQAAQEYTDRQDYAMAEALYKQVVGSEPNNAEALKALASVLYREDKIDESTAILDRIPKN